MSCPNHVEVKLALSTRLITIVFPVACGVNFCVALIVIQAKAMNVVVNGLNSDFYFSVQYFP